MNQFNVQNLPILFERLHQELKSHRISLSETPSRYLRDLANGKGKPSRSNTEHILTDLEQVHKTAEACQLLLSLVKDECGVQFSNWADFKRSCLDLFATTKQGRTEGCPSPHNNRTALTDRWFPILTLHARWNAAATLYGAPIPIQELYTELYLVETEPIATAASPTESYFQRSYELTKERTQAVESVLDKIQHRAVFIGDPGTGKSTLSKWIARYLVENFRTSELFPVLIFLRDFSAALEVDSSMSLIDYFLGNSCQFQTDDLPALRDLFSSETKEDFLFILDGWDEVPPPIRTKVLSAIEEVSLNGKILVTSRPSGIPSVVAKDADIVCQIGPLSHFAIRSLVSKICGRLGQEDKAVPLFQQIDHYPQLGRLASNPFTLTLLTQIVCQGQFAVEELRTSTILFQKAVQLIQRDHNSNAHLCHLGEDELDLLRKNAAMMSFAPGGKKLQCHASDFPPTGHESVIRHPVLQSRFLTRPSEFDEAYCFLHLQLQEFFAGQRLATLPREELERKLEESDASWEHLEEWRFTAGSLSPKTPQWHVFWDYWRKRLQRPDLFGGIRCLVAYLVAESEEARAFPWSAGLVESLWKNVFEQGWRNPSLRALIFLDPLTLVEKLKENLCADTLKRVFNLMPQGLQYQSGLYEWIASNPDLDWLIGECALTLSPPHDLAKLRQLIRNQHLSPKERLHALQLTSGYHDEESIRDAQSLLTIEDDTAFEGAAHRLGTLGGPEAAMILTRQLLDEGKSLDPRINRITSLIGVLSAPIYSTMEAHSRNHLLSQISPNQTDKGITMIVLDALRQCPMGEDAEPIVRLLETSKDSDILQAASNALAKCSSPRLLNRCLRVSRTTADSRLRGILLRCLINGKPDLSPHFSWFLENIENPRHSHWEKAPFFGLLRHAKLTPLQAKKLSRIILPTLRSLTKGDATETQCAHLDACHLLQGEDKREAHEILTKIIRDPSFDLSHRQQACSILSDFSSTETQAALLETLHGLRKAETRQANDSYFERALISAVLRISPEALFDTGWKLQATPGDVLFGELRNWSEENLAMIFHSSTEMEISSP